MTLPRYQFKTRSNWQLASLIATGIYWNLLLTWQTWTHEATLQSTPYMETYCTYAPVLINDEGRPTDRVPAQQLVKEVHTAGPETV